MTCLKKEKTAKLIPNAIQICTESEKVSRRTCWGAVGTGLSQPLLPQALFILQAELSESLAFCLFPCHPYWPGLGSHHL